MRRRAREGEAEERKQSSDFKEIACCPSGVVQRAAWQKIACVREVPGVTGTLRKAKSHFNSTQAGSGTEPPG